MNENLELVSDVTDLTEKHSAQAFEAHWGMVHEIHADSMLHPCAEDLVFVFAGTKHLHQFSVHFKNCTGASDGHLLWLEDPEFVPWLDKNVLSTFTTEPIRAFHAYWRGPDFAVSSVVCEVEGYVHDFVTIPALGRPMMTPMSIADEPMDQIRELGRHVWGAAWSEIPCTHKLQDTHEHDEEE